MSRYVYRITGILEFPEGVMPGEGSESNNLTIAYNGKGDPVLRGTSLAGAIRHRFDSAVADVWFGTALDADNGQGSRVRVADSILEAGKSSIAERTHHARNRHTGTIFNNGLFTMEYLPPGTICPLLLYVDTCNMKDSDPAWDDFLDCLKTILGSGLTLGGNRNRGLGRVRCKDSEITIHEFDLSRPEEYAAWMDTRFNDRKRESAAGGQKHQIINKSEDLRITLTLNIPRGEDLLIADGHDMTPQETTSADGRTYWKLPGASLRGLFRSWMTRLAVREGKSVRDSYDRWDDELDHPGTETYKHHLIGLGFPKDEEEKAKFAEDPDRLNDPILSLFGSMYRRGRIHITDALSSRPADRARDLQDRAHVAIDRFSGGANEGALFFNQVLIASDLDFITTITMEKPDSKEDLHEVQWLIQTLRALQLGILSVGSSKSAGRLEISSIKAEGDNKEMIDNFAAEIL